MKWPFAGKLPSHSPRAPEGPGPRTRLRSERDRFVAFAFAGSDLLLELDRAGRIGFAAGAAVEVCGADTAQLRGRTLADLVAFPERPRIERTLDQIWSRYRAGPERFSILTEAGARAVWLAGCRLADDGVIRLSLRAAPAGAPPLATAEQFRAHLLERLATPGSEERLTMLDLPGLADPAHCLSAEERAALDRELVRVLGGFASGADDAGWLAEQTVGVVHGDEVDPSDIDQAVRALGLGAAEGEPGGGVATLGLDRASLSQEDAGQALLYAINRFAADRGREFTLGSLGEGLKALVAETVQRVGSCRDTLDRESFDLVFQPIVDLKTRVPSHYEVLTRLETGTSPFEMVTFAEQVGLVADLDLRVARRSFECLRGKGRVDYGLSLNLSGRTLESDPFSQALLRLVDQYGDLAGRITFELTESAEVRSPERVAKVLAALRRRGFAVSLDDFGSGAASFDYLRLFRFDYVKVDGSYIKSTDHRDQAIVVGMITLCRELGVQSIAEMVETRLQAERLTRLKFDYGQGYLFGGPGPLP